MRFIIGKWIKILLFFVSFLISIQYYSKIIEKLPFYVDKMTIIWLKSKYLQCSFPPLHPKIIESVSHFVHLTNWIILIDRVG